MNPETRRRYQTDAPFRHLVCTLNEVQEQLKTDRDTMIHAAEASSYLVHGPKLAGRTPGGNRYYTQEDVHLWLIKRNDGCEPPESWISAVVAAKNAVEARKIHPSGLGWGDERQDEWCLKFDVDNFVQAQYIGNAGLTVNIGDVIHNHFLNG